eukprot:TRINITY_DN9628_c0_g1_i2.p1 TRINITY_DN9628_c0_g1~~TRINITY_DN9628_c0_g1_i2.p1  ORF type:complete len:257 (-),score=49.80 TRINITY_DN9628_c0_g1_i2:299-1069(-)
MSTPTSDKDPLLSSTRELQRQPAEKAPEARRVGLCNFLPWRCYLGSLLVGAGIAGALYTYDPSEHMLIWTVAPLCAAFVLFPFVGCILNHFVTLVVKGTLQSLDRTLIGVDIEVGDISSNLCMGLVHIDSLRVANPVDEKTGKTSYHSDHLLRASELHIDLDLWALFTSLGKKIVIERLIFQGVSIFYEKTWTTSNLQQVLDFVDKKGKEQAAGAPPPKDPEKGKPDDKEQAAPSKPAAEGTKSAGPEIIQYPPGT